jgi:N-acetylglucosaminyldiphosphoundecaprenol N-acetyl-beta-D-mannosaminyltransferase
MVKNTHPSELIYLFKCPMHPWTMNKTVTTIKHRIEINQFTQHVVVNVAKLVNMQSDTILKTSVTKCNIINIDGMGIVWIARFLGYFVPERVTGIDLFYQLLIMSTQQSYSIFLLGAEQEIIKKTVENIKKIHPHLNIAGYHHGYFWNNQKVVVDKIKKSGATLLFVAITSPKKENFINQWKDQLGVHFVMGVGGTFDIIAGKTKRAPLWMQKWGLEWVYRIVQEPKRMWKRYLITNTYFLWLFLKAIFSYKKF